MLQALEKRADTYGWTQDLFTISNQAVPVTNKNLVTQYGVLTLANVQVHAATYMGQQSRAAQAAVQVRHCNTASVGPDILMKLVNWKEDYTINGMIDGTCMVKTLISMIVIETRATISVLAPQVASTECSDEDSHVQHHELQCRSKRIHYVVAGLG